MAARDVAERRQAMSCREGLPHYCPNCDRTFSDTALNARKARVLDALDQDIRLTAFDVDGIVNNHHYRGRFFDSVLEAGEAALAAIAEKEKS
jgi:hypothetical protein